MRSQKENRYLTYIQESISMIEVRTAAGRDAFLTDPIGQDAVLWRLPTLGEATGHLSAEVKERHPEIAWQSISGFRNVAAHAYLDLDLTVTWRITQAHLPALKAVVEEELARPPSE